MTTPVLQLRDCAFGYDGHPVIEGVSLTIDPGEVVAILGPNGAGKSTLVKGLVGLTELLGGSARVLGHELNDVAPGTIGYVPQRHTLASSVRATVAEIVAIGRLRFRTWWQPWRRDPQGDRQAVARVLDLVGLGDRAGSDVGQLSGGQQRRVLIARALASVPELLVMDEPTAGVDYGSQVILAGVLNRLAAGGTTQLIVTHELDALAAVVTRVIVIDKGGIAFDGSAERYAAAAISDAPHHHHSHSPDALPGRRGPTPQAGPLDPMRGHHA